MPARGIDWLGWCMVLATIGFTCLGQIVLKSVAASSAGAVSGGLIGRLLAMMQTPGYWLVAVISLAAMCTWAMALTRLPISTAYPCTAASFIVVVLWGALVHREPLPAVSIAGILLVVAGIVLVAWGFETSSHV